ncbi:MAG: hypothetical protein JXA82_04885 [Sedimentisphaerales bacterium]|nr:hypothetical protein [Sedimentisphaerales bacterium]
MKSHFYKAGLMLSLIVLFVGCGKKENEPTTPSPEMENAKKEVGEAVTAAKTLIDSKKDEVVKAMQANLDQLQTQMTDLQAKAKEKGEQAMAEFEKQKAQFDVKLTEAKAQFTKLKDSGADAWKGVQEAAQAAYDELEKTYNEIAAKYK